jgi:hypothetical protein
MAKSSKMKIYDEWLANQNFRSSIPSLETCDILLDAYFRTSESAFRIFHVPTFRKEYNQYLDQPLLMSDSFILKMLLAMAIGLTFYQESNVELLRTQAEMDLCSQRMVIRNSLREESNEYCWIANTMPSTYRSSKPCCGR